MANDENIKSRSISAGAFDRGLRLDVFLNKNLAHLSRSQVQRLIRDGHVLWDGRRCRRASQIIGGHELFSIEMPPPEVSSIRAEPIALDILYSDRDIAVIDKPSGLVVHPGAGVRDSTMVNALLHHFPDMQIGNVLRPGIVHRLDKDTSGLMLVALSHRASMILSDDFKHRRIEKLYRAFVFGDDLPDRFELRTGHARHPHNRLRFFTRLPEPKSPSAHVRLAHTSFSVLNRGFGICELRAELHTGRTHQIRAHLSDMGHPLIRDLLYGGDRALRNDVPLEVKDAVNGLKRQALHAECLRFIHPLTKVPMSLRAPLPSDLSPIEAVLRR